MPPETESESYFRSKPLIPEEIRSLVLDFEGSRVPWQVAPGVFQGKGLDEGTRLLLESVPEESEGPFLDLGCGHGPLGLLHLRRFPDQVLVQTDVNLRALALTQRNARSLGLPTLVAKMFTGQALASESIEVVLTNPPIRAGNEVLFEIFREAARVLRPGGRLYFVGRAKQGVRRLAKKAGEALGGEPEKQGRNKGFEVYRIRKPQGA